MSHWMVVPRLKECKFLKSADRSQRSSSRFLPWPHFQRWESFGYIFLESCRTQTAASLTPAWPSQKNKSKHRQINLCRSSSRLTRPSPAKLHLSQRLQTWVWCCWCAVISARVSEMHAVALRCCCVCLFPAPLLCFGYHLGLLSFTIERVAEKKQKRDGETQKPGHAQLQASCQSHTTIISFRASWWFYVFWGDI